MKCNEIRDFTNKNNYCNNNEGVKYDDSKTAINGMLYI